MPQDFIFHTSGWIRQIPSGVSYQLHGSIRLTLDAGKIHAWSREQTRLPRLSIRVHNAAKGGKQGSLENQNFSCFRMAEVKELDPDGIEPVQLRSFSLSMNDVTVQLSTVGASITKILVPCYSNLNPNQVDDVTLGYKSPSLMLESGNPPYFGVIVGRVANRIDKGTFNLSKAYSLDINNEPNHLHGGIHGFSHCIWNAEIIIDPVTENENTTSKCVKFSLLSRDGDQGYPGTVKVTAIYSLVPTNSADGAALRLVMTAELLDNKATPINLAQHTYFNLASHKHPDGVLNHLLTLPSGSYTPVDATSIPTRVVSSVESKPSMDWRSGKIVRNALVSFGVEQAGLTEDVAKNDLARLRYAPDIAVAGKSSPTPGEPYGFDHNYIVAKKKETGLNIAGILEHAETRRKLTLWTDAPGVQLYTANYLDGASLDRNICKESACYGQWQGLCLETQHYPDSIIESEEDTSSFAKGKCVILRPGGSSYSHTVEYHFESI